MKIPADLIRHYLRPIVAGRGASEPDPMADLDNFNGDIREMRRRAAAAGDLSVLRLALVSLVMAPGGRLRDFAGTQYPFNDGDLEAVLRHALERAWPDDPLPDPGTELPVELADIPEDEWRAEQATDLGF
ncbi:MAG TPA: hypothetical protein PKD10_12030 [Paracoccaceae bacterium]|nr:hypothetical protein [Paracoccaceae bacterium]HMO71686.1 hypothetical protein [Paracoccaceae bacterium]